ncbi:MAG: hypothetical protein ACK4MQ_10785 [Hyphomonas sp.]
MQNQTVMNDKPWTLSLTSEPQRRRRTKRDDRPRYGSHHARDFLTVGFADLVASGIMTCNAELDVESARARLENVRIGTQGGKLGGCPKLTSGIWKAVTVNAEDEAKANAERNAKIAWMLKRYQENSATMTGRKAVREMLRDAGTLEYVTIPGGIGALSEKRIDAIRAQCDEALKTP